MKKLLCLAILALVLTTVACKKKPPTEIVVGIQSEPMGGVVSALHIVVKVAGETVIDEKVVALPEEPVAPKPEIQAPPCSDLSNKLNLKL